MNRIVPAALTAVALLVPASLLAPPASSAPAEAGRSITGTWKGQVFGDKGADAGYTARVRIFRRDGAGSPPAAATASGATAAAPTAGTASPRSSPATRRANA